MDHYKELVPDKATAVAIAEVVAVKIYGKDVIGRQRPLVAKKEGGNWIVQGTMAQGRLGGVVLIKLQAKDCRVLRVTHGR